MTDYVATITRPDPYSAQLLIPKKGTAGFHKFWKDAIDQIPRFGVLIAEADKAPRLNWFYKCAVREGVTIRYDHPKLYIVRL